MQCDFFQLVILGKQNALHLLGHRKLLAGKRNAQIGRLRLIGQNAALVSVIAGVFGGHLKGILGLQLAAFAEHTVLIDHHHRAGNGNGLCRQPLAGGVDLHRLHILGDLALFCIGRAAGPGEGLQRHRIAGCPRLRIGGLPGGGLPIRQGELFDFHGILFGVDLHRLGRLQNMPPGRADHIVPAHELAVFFPAGEQLVQLARFVWGVAFQNTLLPAIQQQRAANVRILVFLIGIQDPAVFQADILRFQPLIQHKHTAVADGTADGIAAVGGVSCPAIGFPKAIAHLDLQLL